MTAGVVAYPRDRGEDRSAHRCRTGRRRRQAEAWPARGVEAAVGHGARPAAWRRSAVRRTSRAAGALAIRLYDARWSSNEARAEGERAAWRSRSWAGRRDRREGLRVGRSPRLSIRKLVPLRALRAAASVHKSAEHKQDSPRTRRRDARQRAPSKRRAKRVVLAAAYAYAAAAACTPTRLRRRRRRRRRLRLTPRPPPGCRGC